MSKAADPKNRSRRRSRELALQVLFALDMQERRPGGGDSPRTSDPDRAFEDVSDHFEMPEPAREFAQQLVREVAGRRASLDSLIAEHSRNWRVERMAVVDRNVLRVATYELAYTETPAPVILDEAVEMARRYSGDPSPAFVNGILDAIATHLRGRAA